MLAALPLLAACAGLGEGAEHYGRGEYPEAVSAWEEAGGASPSGRLHFDLGNAWYRQGEVGMAIAHYRAAQRLRPRDGDVHHNLALARNDTVGTPRPVVRSPSWMSFVTAGELGVLGVLVLAAGSLMLVRRRGGAPGPLRGAAIVWVVGAMLCLVASGGAWSLAARPVLVVHGETTQVRALPRADSGKLHHLPTGSEVQLVERRGAFLLVEDGEGRRGWVPVGAVVDVGAR